MKMSDSIGAIGAALGKFQANVPKIEKDGTVKVRTRTGGEYSFRYATMDNILDTIRPTLAKFQLAYTHLTNNQGGIMCMLIHDSGEWIATDYLEIPAALEKDKPSPTAQAVGSAITYARRYTLCAILGITADEDDDGSAATGNTYSQSEEDSRPWLNKNTEEWSKAVKAITEGRRTVLQILAKRRLNKANRAELETIENAVVA